MPLSGKPSYIPESTHAVAFSFMSDFFRCDTPLTEVKTPSAAVLPNNHPLVLIPRSALAAYPTGPHLVLRRGGQSLRRGVRLLLHRKTWGFTHGAQGDLASWRDIRLRTRPRWKRREQTRGVNQGSSSVRSGASREFDFAGNRVVELTEAQP